MMPITEMTERVLWGSLENMEKFQTLDKKLSPLQAEKFKDFIMKWALSELPAHKVNHILLAAFEHASITKEL